MQAGQTVERDSLAARTRDGTREGFIIPIGGAEEKIGETRILSNFVHLCVRLGAPAETVSVHTDEVGAARDLFTWARAGDMLLLATQAQREAVLNLVGTLQSAGWRPGELLPDGE